MILMFVKIGRKWVWIFWRFSSLEEFQVILNLWHVQGQQPCACFYLTTANNNNIYVTSMAFLQGIVFFFFFLFFNVPNYCNGIVINTTSYCNVGYADSAGSLVALVLSNMWILLMLQKPNIKWMDKFFLAESWLLYLQKKIGSGQLIWGQGSE